jgi:hypothetical protein
MMKRWLVEGGNYQSFGLTAEDIEQIKGKDVTFSHRGTRIFISKEEIFDRLENRQVVRDECVYDFIQRYIKNNFVPTTYRNYSRRRLRKELSGHLEAVRVALSDELWSFTIRLLGDKSLYRKFKLKRVNFINKTSTESHT